MKIIKLEHCEITVSEISTGLCEIKLNIRPYFLPSFAKSVTKIYTRMLFDFTKRLNVRASIPFHIFLEEAHRYVQNDNDIF